MFLGLKIDVCTYDGLRLGVPNLLRLLDRHKVRASFFVALGPDTSGRAIFQVFRPGFLSKMRRTKAIRTYGLRTILSGTLLPPRHIGRGLAHILRGIAHEGHEVAIHGYDHRRWQDHLHRMDALAIRAELDRAVAAYREILGTDPRGFGAPGWQCNAASLRLLDLHGFVYASDTRGSHPFVPLVDGRALRIPQLPTTVPTLDEALRLAVSDTGDFVRLVQKAIGTQRWPVLTIHAEMEGTRYLSVADRLLDAVGADGATFVPLENMLKIFEKEAAGRMPMVEVVSHSIHGRAGTVSMPSGLEIT